MMPVEPSHIEGRSKAVLKKEKEKKFIDIHI